MKSLVGKFGTLALLAAVGGFAMQGCSSDISRQPGESAREGDSGQVTLNLVPVSGITVNSVNYVVTGTPAIAGTPLPSGVLPTPGTSNNFTFGIPVPVGTGYTLSLTAVSAETGDNITCTGSSAVFDVTPNSASAFPMTLTCVDNSNGQLVATVDVKTNACPRLIPDYASGIPGAADVGSSIALNALGHDLDGKTVTYAWSLALADAAVGTFSNATSAAASLLCKGAGSSIPVTVTMKNGECSKTLITTVSCKSLTCGDGTLEAGEDCDPAIAANAPGGTPVGAAANSGCPSNCHETCGNSIVEAPTEQCDPANTATCDAQCRTRVASCGDGFINGTEVCDVNGAGVADDVLPAGSPAGSSCKADCSSVVAPVCGDGVVSAGEQCELPNTAACGYNCQQAATDACVTCETTSNCKSFSLACLTSTGTASTTPFGGNGTVSTADQAKCYDVEECVTRTGCSTGAGGLTDCFCGSMTTAQCGSAPDTGAGAPAGVCHDAIKAGMGITGDASKPAGSPATNTEILARFTTRGFAAGAGLNRFNCLKNNPACGPACGF